MSFGLAGRHVAAIDFYLFEPNPNLVSSIKRTRTLSQTAPADAVRLSFAPKAPAVSSPADAEQETRENAPTPLNSRGRGVDGFHLASRTGTTGDVSPVLLSHSIGLRSLVRAVGVGRAVPAVARSVLGRRRSPLPEGIGQESGIRLPKPFPQRNLGVPAHG
jgi:hypothetical protein